MKNYIAPFCATATIAKMVPKYRKPLQRELTIQVPSPRASSMVKITKKIGNKNIYEVRILKHFARKFIAMDPLDDSRIFFGLELATAFDLERDVSLPSPPQPNGYGADAWVDDKFIRIGNCLILFRPGFGSDNDRIVSVWLTAEIRAAIQLLVNTVFQPLDITI